MIVYNSFHFSYGIVIWEMLSGDIPHKGKEPTEIIHKSQAGELFTLHVAQSFPEHYKLLLNSKFKLCMINPPVVFIHL